MSSLWINRPPLTSSIKHKCSSNRHTTVFTQSHRIFHWTLHTSTWTRLLVYSSNCTSCRHLSIPYCEKLQFFSQVWTHLQTHANDWLCVCDFSVEKLQINQVLIFSLPEKNPASVNARQYRKIGNSQKWKLSFFRQRHTLLCTLSTSFDIFVITYRVTNFLPKLVNMLLFSTEKTEFPFLVFPYFRVMPECTITGIRIGFWSIKASIN